MISPNVLPLAAAYSSLDIFERSAVLITFVFSFEKQTGPTYAPYGSTIEFEVVGDQNNFFDLQKIFLEVNCKIV